MSSETHSQEQMAVFDICDTLYYSNTTHDFVRFVVDGEPLTLRNAFYKALNGKLLPFRYLLIFYGVRTGRDVLKKFNVSVLRGKSRDQLAALAKRFVSEFLDRRRIEHTHDLINAQKSAGRRVVLCSSSIEPVVSAVADALGTTDFVGTTLEYSGDVFTGRIADDITQKKVQSLKERGLTDRLAFAASDNTSDLELLTTADESVAIVHGGRKADFWRQHNLNTIDPGQ